MRACPGCLTHSQVLAGESDGFRLMRCSRCHTLFTERLPATPDEAMDYAQYYHEGNLQVPRCVESSLDTVVQHLDVYRRLNRWLDVGCGAGTLMRAASRRGWVTHGIEVAPRAAEALRRDGFEVHLGTIEDAPFAHASFDVVSVVEVVEHVADCESLLRAASRMVRPGGAMYLTTPNGRGLSARVLGTRWSAVAPPEHLQLFSIAGLRTMVERSGLRVRRIHVHAVNPGELVAALRRSEARTATERVATGYELNESLTRTRKGVAAKATANAVLNACRLGDTLKLTAERPA